MKKVRYEFGDPVSVRADHDPNRIAVPLSIIAENKNTIMVDRIVDITQLIIDSKFSGYVYKCVSNGKVFTLTLHEDNWYYRY